MKHGMWQAWLGVKYGGVELFEHSLIGVCRPVHEVVHAMVHKHMSIMTSLKTIKLALLMHFARTPSWYPAS